MYGQIGIAGYTNAFAALERDSATIAGSNQLDALIALERIDTRRSYSRNDEIYAEATPRIAGTRLPSIPFGCASFAPETPTAPQPRSRRQGSLDRRRRRPEPAKIRLGQRLSAARRDRRRCSEPSFP